MSDPRKFGTILTANHRRGQEWSPVAKGAMIGMRMAGMSQRQVASKMGTDHKAVGAIEKRFAETGSVESKPRSGRPWALNAYERRYIIRLIRKDRFISWAALSSAIDDRVCLRTLPRVVSFHYKRKWKAMERPRINSEQAKQRRQFVRIWLPQIEELNEMICSDESTITNTARSSRSLLFRAPHEKYNVELVNTTDHVKPTISRMYWAGIWRKGRTRLIPMKRDPIAPKQGYSSWSYEIALRDGLIPSYDGTRRFQQDNASIHTAKAISKWFLYHKIELIDWPPNSPDMSPIENLWNLLKDNIADRAEFDRCVLIAWADIPQSTISKLMGSLER